MTASAPRPCNAVNCSAGGVVSPNDAAFCRIARARGWALCASNAAAHVSNSWTVWPCRGITSCTVGCPQVKVPVLSKAMARRRAGASSEAPPLMRTPARAAAVSPATSLTGDRGLIHHGVPLRHGAVEGDLFPGSDEAGRANRDGLDPLVLNPPIFR